MSLLLIRFNPVSHFNTSWERQKTNGILAFSGDCRNKTLGQNGLTLNTVCYPCFNILHSHLFIIFNLDYVFDCWNLSNLTAVIPQRQWYRSVVFVNFEHSNSDFEQVNHIPSNFLKAVFHKFYLVHSWILCPKCSYSSYSDPYCSIKLFGRDRHDDVITTLMTPVKKRVG